MSQNQLIYYIQKYQLQQIFPEHYLPQLQLITYEKGEAICQQGQELDQLFYFMEGHIKIVRRLFNGKEHILETRKRPTLIGDIELMTQQDSVSSVIALETTRVVQLPLSHSNQLYQDPLFLYQIGRQLAQKLEQQNIISSTNITYSVKERLATYILTNANKGICQLHPTILSDVFGTSYRHLSRVIKQLQEEGLIEKIAFKTYRIKQVKKLQSLIIHD